MILVAEPLPAVALVAGERVSQVGAGLAAFLESVESRDRLSVYLAGAPPRRLRRLTFGKADFGVEAFAEGVYAAPFDAMAAALQDFVPSERLTVLVAFTNAADFRSTVGFDWLASLTQRLGPVFVLLGTPVRFNQDVRSRAVAGQVNVGDDVNASISGWVFPRRLGLLASRTGGTTVNLEDDTPSRLVAELMVRLRTRYIVSYEAPGGPGWHSVDLQVSRPEVRVVVRDGYLVDANEGARR